MNKQQRARKEAEEKEEVEKTTSQTSGEWQG